MFDQLRREFKDQYGFSDEFIENIITYLTNHHEELARVERRFGERGEEG